MGLVGKVWLGIGGTLVAALTVMAWLSYRHSEQNVDASLLEEGRTLHGVLMAVRRTYQKQFLDSGIPVDAHTLGFLPAHAMARISRSFQDFDARGVRFNNVSDRARDPANQADPVEMEAIRYFRSHPQARERLTSHLDPGGQRYYHYATPIWMEPYCLRCHGDPKDAPPAIEQLYRSAWGYKTGELRGILSIKLPAATTEGRILGLWQRGLAGHLGVIVLALLVSGGLLHFLVIRRLGQLQDGIRRLTGGDYAWRVPELGGDETAALARGFNEMARTIETSQAGMRLAASVFSHTQDGILITDARTVIIDANPAFARITGYSRDEVLGQTPRMLASGRHDPDFYRDMWQALAATGCWSGEIWNRRKDGEVYPERLTITAVRDEQGEASHFVGVFSDISQVKAQEEQLVHLAQHDALTGLPNRILLADRMRQAIGKARRSGRLLAVCYLDLDGFKPVNDDHGHQEGDRLLVEMANRMRGILRGGDTVARLGGDEFIFLLQDLKDVEECELSLNRLLRAISEPVAIGDTAVSVSASIGVSLYPNDDEDPDTLIRHADQAMYNAKQAGRSRYHFYDLEGDRRARSHREDMDRLRQALALDEFVLHYQPRIDMQSGQITGAEALVRWQHPDRGLLPPDRFLPVLENTELDTALGNWVLDEALRQLDQWRHDGLRITVSVNISAHHIQCPEFVSQLAAKLAAHPDLAPGDLVLEIVETAALDDLDRVSEIIQECRQLGCDFALDDFGTGYSSLTYLKRLPVQCLKIDQSFVRDMLRDPEDLAIVEGVIALADSFGRDVVAEGVDSLEAGLMLMQLGCQSAQGYRIARPMPASELPGWIARWRAPDVWHEGQHRHWHRENFALLLAEHNHRTWIDHLTNLVEGVHGSDQPVDLDPGSCAFGEWYTGSGRRHYDHLTEFAALETPHLRVHALGQELLTLVAADRADQARARLPELHTLREELLSHLHALQDRVLEGAYGEA